MRLRSSGIEEEGPFFFPQFYLLNVGQGKEVMLFFFLMSCGPRDWGCRSGGQVVFVPAHFRDSPLLFRVPLYPLLNLLFPQPSSVLAQVTPPWLPSVV